MEKGSISFFKIEKCGYYRRHDGKWELVEGSLNETLAMVQGWVKDREFSQTIPWDVLATPGRKQIYCKSVYKNEETNDSVFVLWKRFGEETGGVSGILADSKVGEDKGGSIKLDSKIKGKDVIYGQPMYYWFIPELNIIASIKFPHSLAATDLVIEYLRRCIELRIPDGRKKITESLSENPITLKQVTTKNVRFVSDDGYSLKYLFKAKLKELSISKVDLENLSRKITHIVVRDKIATVVEDDRGSEFKFWDRLTRKQHQKFFSKQVEIVSEADVDSEGLRGMLGVYKEEITGKDSWNDVGFKTDGKDGPTKWFGSYVDRSHILIKPEYLIDDIYFPAKIILKEIDSNRLDILASLINEINNGDKAGNDTDDHFDVDDLEEELVETLVEEARV